MVAGTVAVTSRKHDANAEHVVYKVAGDAKSATVVYTTWNNDSASTIHQSVALPWTKEASTSGPLKGGMLTVMVGAGGGRATCSVIVDNGAPKTATATGPFSRATCQIH